MTTETLDDTEPPVVNAVMTIAVRKNTPMDGTVVVSTLLKVTAD